MTTPTQERTPDETITLPEGVFPVANLIPDSVAGDRRLVRTKRIALAAVVAAVVAVGALWMLLAGQASEAEQQLAQAQTTGVQLKAKQAKYSDIPKVAAQVTAAEANLATVTSGEVVWSSLLAALRATAPADVTVQKVSGAIPAASADAAAATGGSAAAGDAAPVTYGSITVAGTAASFPSVSAWLKSATTIPGVAAATLTRSVRATAADGTSPVAFEATLTLSEKALAAPPATTGGGS